MRLAVFDLDMTVWHPEMYQLSSAPKLTSVDAFANKRGKGGLSPALLQESRTKTDGMVLADKHNSLMRVFDGASFALSDINRMRQEGHPIQAAVASRTDEPKWAYICMEHLIIQDGTTIAACFEKDLIEISYGDKTQHLQRLHKTTGIPYEDMCFFDNEHSNIKTVSKSLPAVKCIYTPDGMTRQAWESAKAIFGM